MSAGSLARRGLLHAEMRDLHAAMRTLRADLIATMWRVFLTGLGLQVVLVGALVAILIEVLGRGAA